MSDGQTSSAPVTPPGHQVLDFQPPHGPWAIRQALSERKSAMDLAKPRVVTV